MFKNLYFHELQSYLYSLRFHVSFVIVVLVFATGSISFVSSYTDTNDNYIKYMQNEQAALAGQAQNISGLATGWRNFIMAPRNNGIVTDCKEGYLPNVITYSAYNVYDFSVRHQTHNPLLSRADSLSWSFIVSMFLSFITLLFAFDAISGEKEDRTLALVFSNPVPRRVVLGSKLASIVTVVGCMLLTGIIFSILILTVSGKVLINGAYLMETAGFMVLSLLLIVLFALFGLFSSVVTRYSNISLLISLCFWLAVAVVIPNTSVFWAKKLFAIPSAFQIEAAINEEKNDINRNAPEGSWSSSSGNPFWERHELRANNQTNLMNAEKRHKDAYYRQMFGQFEKTRNLAALSPIAQFDYINEAFLGGGYLRLRKNWDDLQVFQTQFLQWFKDIDAKDSDSPHWYNPFEDFSTSKKPVEVDQIPRYQEQIAPFAQRIQFVTPYLITLLVTIGALFGACFYFFVRYDVR
jgi:ABC-type transport system involved in multi-copper enzyme maturation permease subunit